MAPKVEMSHQDTLIRRAKEWVTLMASGRRGLFGVSIAAFLESSFVPFPLEVLLIPAFHTAKSRVWLLAAAALAGCFVAAVAFYVLGTFLQDAVLSQIAGYLEITDALETFYNRLNENGFWVVFTISLLPAPIQVATLGSGAAGYSFPLFAIAVLTSRFVRFFGLAALVIFFGDKVEQAFKKMPRRYGWAISIFVIAAIVFFVLR